MPTARPVRWDYVNEQIITATVHGRYLVHPPAVSGPAPLLVGFHGYAEGAEIQLERLRAIPGSEDRLCVSIQALHPFYRRRDNHVVASWMTSQERDHAIADNIAYVNACLDAVISEWTIAPGAVFTGFSQGVAMAYRAAVHSSLTAAGVVAAGGDIPPELAPESLHRIQSALLIRGTADAWYTKEKLVEDERRLRSAGVEVASLEFTGGHEWSAEATAAAGQFMADRQRPTNSRAAPDQSGN